MTGSQVHSKVWRFRTQGNRFRSSEARGSYCSHPRGKRWQAERVLGVEAFPSKADKLESTSYIFIIVKGKFCCRGTMKSILSSIK